MEPRSVELYQRSDVGSSLLHTAMLVPLFARTSATPIFEIRHSAAGLRHCPGAQDRMKAASRCTHPHTDSRAARRLQPSAEDETRFTMDLSLAAATSSKQCPSSNSAIVHGLEIRTASGELSRRGISLPMADAGRLVDAELRNVRSAKLPAIDGCAKVQVIGLGGTTI